MSLLLNRLSSFWSRVNGRLFPALEDANVEMTPKLYKFVALLEFLQIELFVPHPSSYQVGAKPHARRCLARAFVAKAFYNAPATKSFRDRLLHDNDLRKVIGWACRGDVPSESTFSRAVAWFADIGLTNGVLEAQIKVWLGDTIIRDVATDSTAIEAREKPLTRAKPKTDTSLVETASLMSDDCAAEKVLIPLTDSVRESPADASLIDTVSSDVELVTIAPLVATKPDKATTSKKSAKTAAKNKALAQLYTPTEMTRLDRQIDQLPEMALFELSTACDVGCQTNSKGNKDYWIGYKFHVRVAEGNLPLFAVTTSASVHDSQVTIPMMKITDRSVTSLYELEDRGYDAFYIRKAAELSGHIPIIDFIRRRGQERARELEPDRAEHYKSRTVVERFNARLKDEFGGEMVRVRGNRKVHTHLMFGLLLIFADQLLRLIQ
jgi:hypothetical protein